MSGQQPESPPRKLRLFGYNVHAAFAAIFAVSSVILCRVVIELAGEGPVWKFVLLTAVIWGSGFYFSMSAVMANAPIARFIGLASFGVIEWQYLLVWYSTHGNKSISFDALLRNPELAYCMNGIVEVASTFA